MVELSKQNRKAGHLFAMKTITQTIRFRQAVMEYSDQHGVTKAAIHTGSIVNTFTGGTNAMMEHCNRRQTFPTDRFRKQLAIRLTTISLCVLSTGALPSRSYSLSLMCNTSLTNPQDP